MYVSFGQGWVYWDKEHSDAMLDSLIYQSGEEFRAAKYQFRRDDQQYGEEMSHAMTDAMDEEDDDESDGNDSSSSSGVV